MKFLKSSHLKIALPTLLLTLVIALYWIFWQGLATQAEAGLNKWQAKEAERGLIAEWQDMSFSDFPYRFVTTLEKPELADTRSKTNWAWRSESLRATVQPYNLKHIILDITGPHLVTYTPKTAPAPYSLTLTTDGFWASHVYETGPMGRLAIDVTGAASSHFDAQGTLIEQWSAERLQLHGHPTPSFVEENPDAKTYPFDLALQGESLRWNQSKVDLWPGDEIQLLRMQSRMRNVPVHMMKGRKISVEKWLRDGGSLAISDLILNWGPIDLTAKGELRMDSQGRPAGKLKASLGNLDALVEALVAADVVGRRTANLAFTGLQALSALQGEKEGRVRIPIVLKDGVLFLGPLSIARLDPLF